MRTFAPQNAPPHHMVVSATLKGRADSFGRLTVNIRITNGNSRKFKATNIRVHPNDFGGGKVKTSHPDHVTLNRKILEQIMEVERQGGFADDVKEISFNDYAMHLLNAWDKQKHWDTLRHYRSSLNKFNQFKPGIALKNVTADVLTGFYNYCFSLGNKPNTVWTSFRFMRVVIRTALRENKITDNPFKLFQMPKYRDPQKIYLTEDQIKLIEKARVNKKYPEEIRFAATWFLIGVYSGLRFGDMRKFDKRINIKNNRLVVYTSKTLEVVGMPVSRQLKELFESIEYKPLHFTNEHYNRLLKQLQGLCEIEDKLTGHVSRHTAAVRWANAGLSQEVVAKLLGHNSLRTTAIYFKITNKRIDDELRKLE